MKPTLPAVEVEKAQAIAGFAAGQAAREKGYDVGALRALAQMGRETVIGALRLRPHGLQVQLCQIEHASLYAQPASDGRPDGQMRSDLRRLTHYALIYSDPETAFDILTATDIPDEVKRADFDMEAFKLAAHFESADSIMALSAHIAAQMGLLKETQPLPPEPATEDGPGKPVPASPPSSGRRGRVRAAAGRSVTSRRS